MMPFNPTVGQPPNEKKPSELIQNIKPLLKELMASPLPPASPRLPSAQGVGVRSPEMWLSYE